MSNDFGSSELPRKRLGWHVHWLAHSSWARILICGLMLYGVTVLFFSCIEAISLHFNHHLVEDSQGASAGFWDILYFNFVTILTIGYGEFTPVNLGRILSMIEALFGIGFFGLIVAVVTAKLLAPPRDTVVFSRFAYYCLEDQRFLLIFVNTTKDLLINVEMSSYFKLGGDWVVRPSIRSPFVGQSVQTFFLDKVPLEDLIRLLQPTDVFRLSISGRVGDVFFATPIEYSANEILVLPNRKVLTEYPGFRNPNFSSSEMAQMFHYRPDDAPSLDCYIAGVRQ
jgi:hypothetical protein